MKRCVIIGGAEINNYTYLRSLLREDDFTIFCDSGLRHAAALELTPDLIVGDFDSHEQPNLPIETIVLPCEKDDTDSFFAVKQAVARGFREFLLLGMVGGRLDHTLANLSILLYLDSLGLKACMADDYSELEVVSRIPSYVSDRYAFFSVLNLTGRAKGITIRDAKYPLESADIPWEYQYGVSNEVLPGKAAEISVEQGSVLLIKDR